MSQEAVAPETPFLAVVRRGDERAYRFVRERFSGGQLVEVRWDARVQDRRATPQVLLPERRRKDRRGPTPGTWATLGFLLAPVGARGNGHGGNGSARTGGGAVHPGMPIRPATPVSAARVAVLPRETPRAAPVSAAPARVAAAAVLVRSGEAARPPAGRLGSVVALVRSGTAVFPSFYDTAVEGWRCGRCDEVLRVREAPRRREACRTCQAQVVRVLRWRWQQVNWVALATLGFLAFLAVRVVWPLVATGP